MTKPQLDLARKSGYCLRMMRLGRRLAEPLSDDYSKRVCARGVFVFLDSYLKLAPRLKNELRSPSRLVRHLTGALNALNKDYSDFYDRIRDSLAAHRQHLPLADALEAWSAIDVTALDYLIEEAYDSYNGLHRVDPVLVPAFVDSSDYGDATLDRAVAALAPLQSAGEVQFANDSLALSRPGTVSTFAGHPMQASAQAIVSIGDTIESTASLITVVGKKSDAHRFLKSMLTIDAVNLFDHLLLSRTQPDGAVQPSFLEFSRTLNLEGLSVLLRLEQKANFDRFQALRKLRNQICAHVDPAEPFDSLLGRLDALHTDDLIPGLRRMLEYFNRACAADIRTSIFLVHRQEAKGFVLGVEPTGYLRGFDS